MKRCTFLLSVSFLMLAASASLAQSIDPSPTPPTQISDPEKVCPRVSVSCPSAPDIWELVEFSASISGGDPNAKPTYTWEVSNGVITEGQGTSTIKVSRVERQTVTATLRVGGLDAICATTASCSTAIHLPVPPAEKFDSYGSVAIDDERARLSLFAAQLLQQPGAQGYVLFYGGRRGSPGASRAAGKRAKAHLVKERGIAADRIVIVEGGLREKLTVELWIVPMGSIPPKPEPTIDSGTVKPIKSPVQKTAKDPGRQ
jgi:hypothetical protein